MRILVVDDYVSAEETVAAALAEYSATKPHMVTGVRTPEALDQVHNLEDFGLAFVDLDFRRISATTGLHALRLLDQAHVPAVIYVADDEDNRVLFLLAAFQFYDPVALISKRASRADIRSLVATIDAGSAPQSPTTQRYKRPRIGPSILDRLIVRAEDLPVWRALGTHSDRGAIAKAVSIATRTLDNFLADRFDAAAEVETKLLGRSQGEMAASREQPAAGQRHEHRLAPMHAFATEHHHFFQDAEVEILIRERDGAR